MWEINLNDQIVTFLLSLVMGGLFCLAFDFTRAVRLFTRCPDAAVFFLDLIYFALAAVVDFCFLLVRCNGEIRGFVLFGELAGFLAVRLTVSKLILALLLFLFGILKKIRARLQKFFSAVSAFFFQNHPIF